jgi:hypothetical protein
MAVGQRIKTAGINRGALHSVFDFNFLVGRTAAPMI